MPFGALLSFLPQPHCPRCVLSLSFLSYCGEQAACVTFAAKAMGKNPPKWLPGERVKETILLQRKSVEQLRADRVLRRDKLQERRDRHKAKLDAKRKRKLTTKKFISAQTLLKHAQRKERQGRVFRKIGEKVRGKRQRMAPDVYKKSLDESRVVLIVRARGKQIPPEVSAALRRLGLMKLYAARLLCLNPRTDPLVKQLGPFCIMGHPDPAQLEELLRMRGSLWNEETQTRRLISGNLMLEQALGQYNILCIEDLCDALVKKTEHVQEVLQHIAPFDFHPPRQLFMERHRSVHQKLEIVNKDSFAAYLAQQLKGTAKREKKLAASNKRNAAKQSSLPT
ncbi:60S ribosomal protein L7 [Trypanosoma rangeli SC58]|uniref:60S ribosomal protein L7 n=1 Tax=Trypanosoma rangeli SC58 TaxID=429131 RepID=A0A061J2Q5_TRYRA|nr:60S ribosomal protein L7 [Trypanosoma rangeli SC58]